MQRYWKRVFLFHLASLMGSTTCWAVGLEKMYWSDRGSNTIHRANLDGSNVQTLFTGTSEIRGMALDLAHHMLYWADNGANKIRRSLLDGSQVEDLITQGLGFPAGIALDVEAHKMYWADATNKKIQRANLDGTQVEDFVTGLGSPYFVTLDVQHDQLYWTDYGTDKIQRANLDGTNVVDLVSTGLDLPRGLDLDLEHGKLYWADRQTDLLQRSNLDGSNIETLHQAQPSVAAPHGVAVDAGREHVYWVDNGLVTIERMNTDGSQVVQLLGADSGVLDRPWQIVLDLRTSPPACVATQPCPPGNEDQRIDGISAAILDGVNDPQYDYNRDGQVTAGDRSFLIDYVLNSGPGDADLNGHFDSSDLVLVFAAGLYEDLLPGNAGWRTGDWNGDLEFESSDLVYALSAGGYETDLPVVAVPEASSLAQVIVLLSSLCVVRRQGKRSSGDADRAGVTRFPHPTRRFPSA